MASKQQEAWRRPSSSSVALGVAVALFLPAEWRPITRTSSTGTPASCKVRHTVTAHGIVSFAALMASMINIAASTISS